MNLEKVWQIERATQNRVVNFFQAYLWYEYLWNWEDSERKSPIEHDLLFKSLEKRWYSEKIINKAITKLEKVALDTSKSLYDINKEVYSMLRYWVKVKEDIWENNQTVWLIDWNNLEKNDFAIAEEVTVRGQNTKRPDVVIYINGIALWVIELKRSKIWVSEWIRQNLDNQKDLFIKNFFSTIQFVMAWNDTQWIMYWCIETKEKYYLSWKEESDIDNLLDRHISQICNKNRFLELIHDFIVFDKWTKKLCRQNQYFWVKEAQKTLKKREWWIIWHTQWSWKSLTMVWLTKWILENINDSRILIITDREELDDQIEKVFKWVNEDIYRTKSGKDLIKQLNSKEKNLICSLIHKFWNKTKSDEEYFTEELKNSLPKDFNAKWDIYVFVDECHRTNSWIFHEAMKMILPNAIFIWFTWTPLLAKDKKTSIETFWIINGPWNPYIHSYKFDEAVNDKVVLDLRYEARDIDQKITSQEKIDQWFDAKTRGLTEYALVQLKKKWWTLQRVLSSKSRLTKILSDILLDFETKPRLYDGSGNAMLVAGSIYEACKYYELFQDAWFKKCAIISSYNPTVASIKWETTGWDEETENIEKYETYRKMLSNWFWVSEYEAIKKIEDFEKEVKKKFIDEPGQMKLLIVVDKLLTWFDAPSATYLYIDKSMRDHGLFQAITRVNRLDWESKEYWYIIDYKDLFWRVEKAIWDYTSWAFDAFEKEDVAWLLTDRLEKAKEDLDEALETVKALCEWVWPNRTTTDFMHYFIWKNASTEELKANEQKRHNLYKHVVTLIRSYANIANEMKDAWYSDYEIEKIKKDVKFYTDIRDEIKLASWDYIDLKAYEPAMRHLIDSYIASEDSKKISALDNTSLLDICITQKEYMYEFISAKQMLDFVSANWEAIITITASLVQISGYSLKDLFTKLNKKFDIKDIKLKDLASSRVIRKKIETRKIEINKSDYFYSYESIEEKFEELSSEKKEIFLTSLWDDILNYKIDEYNTNISETIENNIRKLIIDEQEVNPRYYEQMSKLLDEIIKQRREEALEYQEYLRKVVELAKKIKEPLTPSSDLPSQINTSAKKALYDNLWLDLELALSVHNTIIKERKDWFRDNKIKQRELKNALIKVIPANVNIDDLFELIKNQKEY